MKADVARLVAAAERLTDVWPGQPPPAVPEVAVVARHGKAVISLLTALLSDDPELARDRPRWNVQQQATLALSRVYSESAYCGRTYCDGDPPERIANVRKGWLAKIESDAAIHALSVEELVRNFKRETAFRQFEVGRVLAEKGDRRAIRELESLLVADDRHERGNAAFVLARLGDPRGFDTIAQILADRSSPRSINHGLLAGNPSLSAQIVSDRYYAAHLLGELQDGRAVSLLVPLLDDRDINWGIPWALSQIGDSRAIPPLIEVLQGHDASMRVLAIDALEELRAVDALPRLHELLEDERASNFGERISVAAAARHAIAVISAINVTPTHALPISRGAVTYVLPGTPCPSEPAGDKVRVGSVIGGPPLLRHTPPEYSAADRERGAVGVVVLELQIAADGRVKDTKLVRPGVDGKLLKAAIDAVRRWRFARTCFAGKPVPIVYLVAVRFPPD